MAASVKEQLRRLELSSGASVKVSHEALVHFVDALNQATKGHNGPLVTTQRLEELVQASGACDGDGAGVRLPEFLEWVLSAPEESTTPVSEITQLSESTQGGRAPPMLSEKPSLSTPAFEVTTVVAPSPASWRPTVDAATTYVGVAEVPGIGKREDLRLRFMGSQASLEASDSTASPGATRTERELLVIQRTLTLQGAGVDGAAPLRCALKGGRIREYQYLKLLNYKPAGCGVSIELKMVAQAPSTGANRGDLFRAGPQATQTFSERTHGNAGAGGAAWDEDVSVILSENGASLEVHDRKRQAIRRHDYAADWWTSGTAMLGERPEGPPELCCVFDGFRNMTLQSYRPIGVDTTVDAKFTLEPPLAAPDGGLYDCVVLATHQEDEVEILDKQPGVLGHARQVKRRPTLN